MKFLAVFVAIVAVASGSPQTSTWTLNELSNAIQSPGTDPAMLPYLEAALNEMMNALHHGIDMPTITVVIPAKPEISPVQAPEDEPSFIDVWPVQAPEDEPSFIDVWPVQAPEDEPSFIDVWPVQVPDLDVVAPVAVAPAPAASSSPLVQIIVNVQKASDVAASEEVSPVQVEDNPEWDPLWRKN